MISTSLLFELLTTTLCLSLGLLLNSLGMEGWGLISVALLTLASTASFRWLGLSRVSVIATA